MIKGKYMIMAAVLGICTVNISGSCVMAAETQTSESDAYPDLGDSEEEQAYREFLEGGEYFSEVKDLGKVMYASYDVNEDKTKELVIRGMDRDYAYRYLFYQYKDGEVKKVSSLSNWQNGGEGELYYVPPIKVMSVNMRLADHKSYTLYKIAGDTLKCGITLHKQSLDVQGSDGKYHREYAYSITAKDGNDSEKTLTEAGWDEFEDSLEEIPFYDLQVKANNNFTEEQINILKKSLQVPDDVPVTECIASDPWYWDGAGVWVLNIELYEDDVFLAGAAIDPDTLELQREIAPYDEERVAQDKGITSENVQTTTNAPFYGIWCYGGKSEGEAESYAQNMRDNGYDAQVFVTTDWSNLNSEKFYVVTAGVYLSESDANAALPSVQGFYPDAYVKYSGDYQG